MKQVDEKNTPKRNYVIVLVVSILVVAFSLYVRVIYLNNKDIVINKSIFENDNSVIGNINIDDLDFVVAESNDLVIYISYNGDQQIRNMERKLYREIVKNNLVDKVLYLNISGYKEKNEYIKKLKDAFPNIKSDISEAPIMIYIKDGEPIEAVNSEFKMIDYSVLEKLFEKYETYSNLDVDYSS